MTWEYANLGDSTIVEIGFKILHESIPSKQVKYTCNRFQNLQHQAMKSGLGETGNKWHRASGCPSSHWHNFSEHSIGKVNKEKPQSLDLKMQSWRFRKTPRDRVLGWEMAAQWRNSRIYWWSFHQNHLDKNHLAPSMVHHTCNFIIWEVEAGASGVQCHSLLC